MSTWAEIFAPTGFSIRPGQEELGNAIINLINNDNSGILVAQASTGTGKSLATSVPTIDLIHRNRANSKITPRSVISTETITLQSQLCDKDLPFLKKVYGGFTFAKLLGRSNYLCLNRFSSKAVGNKEVGSVYLKLDKMRDRIQTGEYDEICKLLGYTLNKDLWKDMVGDSDECSSNSDCKPVESSGCYGELARLRARNADIVVVNHALLGADYTSKSRGSEEGILGDFDVLVVDEAHRLEDVLSAQWTESSSEWEVTDHVNRVVTGIKNIPSVDFTAYSQLLDSYVSFFETTKKFFRELVQNRGEEWQGSETKFALHYLTQPPSRLEDLMNEYEELGPSVTETMAVKMEELAKTILQFKGDSKFDALTKQAKKEVNKAETSAKFLNDFCSILYKALQTKDGVVSHKGTSYGVIADGWIRRKDGSASMSIRCVPIDISGTASRMFSLSKYTILLSATMSDLTDGTFRYFKRSLGIRDAVEVDVKSPFNMDSQQLVYVTQAKKDVLDSTKFSIEELVELLNASDGRALVLFTSRREINLAKEALTQYKISGLMPYPLLVQEPDVDKAKLVEEFKADTNSVLLGLKSMFTGIDIPGESLSQVIICRWPLPRFSTETRMRMDYWRKAGFPKWYDRESLTVFQQAVGRLIRSDKCIGAVSLIDQRAYDSKEKVFKNAKIGVQSLGSKVTHDPADITRHLIKVDNATI